MKRARAVTVCAVALAAAGAYAQDSIVGRYNASYTTKGINAVPVSVSIIISSAEAGIVKGTGIRGDQSCRGEYPLEGSLKGDQLRLRAPQKGGPTGDCSFGFAGTVKDGALVGKYGPIDLEFRK